MMIKSKDKRVCYWRNILRGILLEETRCLSKAKQNETDKGKKKEAILPMG
jgi:hypothetical protein